MNWKPISELTGPYLIGKDVIFTNELRDQFAIGYKDSHNSSVLIPSGVVGYGDIMSGFNVTDCDFDFDPVYWREIPDN